MSLRRCWRLSLVLRVHHATTLPWSQSIVHCTCTAHALLAPLLCSSSALTIEVYTTIRETTIGTALKNEGAAPPPHELMSKGPVSYVESQSTTQSLFYLFLSNANGNGEAMIDTRFHDVRKQRACFNCMLLVSAIHYIKS